MANPENAKKRSKLVLPAPQISDTELEEVSDHYKEETPVNQGEMLLQCMSLFRW